MQNAHQLALNRKPTPDEFKRIETIWRSTHEGKRRITGSQVEKLAAYFGASFFNAQLRVDSLLSGTLSPSRTHREKRELQKELKLCREIADFLIRKQLSSERPR